MYLIGNQNDKGDLKQDLTQYLERKSLIFKCVCPGRHPLQVFENKRKYKKQEDKKAGRGHIPNRTPIDQRSEVVDKKNRIGDLEMDLIIGREHNGALQTINDRATGILKMGYVKGKQAKSINNKAIELLEYLAPFMHTITTDNGKEFSNHQQIAAQ